MSTPTLPITSLSALVAQMRDLMEPQGSDMQSSYLFTNPRGDLMVAQGLPERTDIVRRGNSVMGRSASVVCVTAMPTTTAPVTLWNGNPTKSLVIDDIGWICTTSAGAASQFGIAIAMQTAPSAAAPATADTLTAVGCNGKVYGGLAKFSHAVTVVDTWMGTGYSTTSAALTATAGLAIEVPVNGGLILPPNYYMGLACIAVNATAAGIFYVTWHEVTLKNAL